MVWLASRAVVTVIACSTFDQRKIQIVSNTLALLLVAGSGGNTMACIDTELKGGGIITC